jgi:hypothetical protein
MNVEGEFLVTFKEVKCTKTYIITPNRIHLSNVVQRIEKGIDINIDGYLNGKKEFESLYNFFATF